MKPRRLPTVVSWTFLSSRIAGWMFGFSIRPSKDEQVVRNLGGLLLVERIGQRLSRHLGLELLHERLGRPQGPGRDLAVLGLFPDLRDELIEGLLVPGEPLALEDLGPLDGAAQSGPA